MFNSYVVAMPDGSHVRHRKLHAFVNEHVSSGSEFTVFDLPNGNRAAILICYDNNLFENTRAVALQGAEILIAPHQTGGCRTPSPRCMGIIDQALWRNRENDPATIESEFRGSKGREWLLRWLPSRAHDNGMFLVFSNGVGIDGDEVRTGNAMILNPYGEILAETWAAADTMIVADLKAEHMRMNIGMRWIQSRRPDLYEPWPSRPAARWTRARYGSRGLMRELIVRLAKRGYSEICDKRAPFALVKCPRVNGLRRAGMFSRLNPPGRGRRFAPI